MFTIPKLAAVFSLIVFLLTSSQSFADDEKKVPKPPKLFSESTEMQVTLTGPFNQIQRNKKKDDLYPVQLTYINSNGQSQSINVEVAPRGITRRLRVCKFPPLKVHFDKAETKGTEFRGNKSLKLVTYCNLNLKYEQYYIKEFLVYRIYNLLTDYSFRVRPMAMAYKDVTSNSNPVNRFSFMIEDVDDLAKRNDIKKLGISMVPYKKLEPSVTTTMALFQFMIGNLDWAATGGPKDDSCCHNTRLIGAGDNIDPKYAVPYDFDSSGLVNAHYASPPDGLKVRNIRQRLYRGFCRFSDQVPQSIELFNQKKGDIIALFKNNELLTDRNKKTAISYIEDYYEIINDPKKLKKSITDKCRGKG